MYELPEDYVYEWCDYVKILWCERALVRLIFDHELDKFFNIKFTEFARTGKHPEYIDSKRYTLLISHEWEERCMFWRQSDILKNRA